MPIKRVLLQGGAWALLGEMGAIHAIDEHMRRDDSVIAKDVKFYSYSAGALVLLAFACGLDKEGMLAIYDDMADVQYSVMNDSWSLSPTKVHLESFKRLFERCPDAYERMNRLRCRVGVSVEGEGFRFFKDFKSNRQLAEIMLGSYHIPCLATYDARLDGKRCIDGGAMFELEKFVEGDPNECLIIKNCGEVISGEAHVRVDIPKLYIAMPIPGPSQRYYLNRGYRMTKQYLDNPHEVEFTELKNKWIPVIDRVWFLRRVQCISYTIDDLNAYVPK